VRLHPGRRAEISDLALHGRKTTVESLNVDYGGNVDVTVVMEGDLGRDLGQLHQPGHRFFDHAGEVEPLSACEGTPP
jgi:hypothetical protein